MLRAVEARAAWHLYYYTRQCSSESNVPLYLRTRKDRRLLQRASVQSRFRIMRRS